MKKVIRLSIIVGMMVMGLFMIYSFIDSSKSSSCKTIEAEINEMLETANDTTNSRRN